MTSPIFHSYFFPDHLSSLQPISGSLTLLQKPFCFTGYLVIGPQPILYALYCSATRLKALKSHVKIIAYVLPNNAHHSVWEQCMEIPIFAKPLSSNDHNTIIVKAIFPFGHYPVAYSEFDHDTLAEMSELLESYHKGSVVPESYHEGSVIPESSVVSPAVPESSMTSSVVPGSSRLSILHSHDDTQPDGTNTQNESNSLHNIQQWHPHWKTVLVHMRNLMRVAICSGESGNPFLLAQTASAGQKVRFIAELFKRSLNEVGLTRIDLGSVKLVDDGSEVTEEEIMMMAGKWVSTLLSEIKRSARIGISDPRPALGFSLTELCPRALLTERCVALLQHFLLPDSGRLPIADNGLVWFLNKEIVKSLVYYLVFRPNTSAYVSVVMADFAPGIFRDVPHLSAEMSAFVGASCYSAILHWSSEILTKMSHDGESPNIDLSLYLPVSQVYDQLLQAAVLLFAQKDDPGYPVFMNRMAVFCNMIIAHLKLLLGVHYVPDYFNYGLIGVVLFIDRYNYTATANRSHSSLVDHYRIAAAKPSCISSALPPISTASSTHHILEIEHTENTLKSLLQKRGREILPDSLFVTVSVLFAWVDPLDLISILQVSLRVVAMERLFQQEELRFIPSARRVKLHEGEDVSRSDGSHCIQ
ncbi:hypothetical protein BDR03DRAFT_1014806 [Suillus americanus]|nr:hypothetical protein BDR03DRAFT_1014806 [Suillus americanus]